MTKLQPEPPLGAAPAVSAAHDAQTNVIVAFGQWLDSNPLVVSVNSQSPKSESVELRPKSGPAIRFLQEKWLPLMFALGTLAGWKGSLRFAVHALLRIAQVYNITRATQSNAPCVTH
jgi:hypothetical protein